MSIDRSRLPVLGPDPAFRFPVVERRRLGNGLALWTIERREMPVLAVFVLMSAGSAADPPGRFGLAAATADLLDEGCGPYSALALHEAIARIGGQLSISVTTDATLIGLVTLTRFREQALALLADLVIRPRMAEEEFVRVRDLRLSRLAQMRNVPSAEADRVFARVAYPGHPYGHLSIGDEASLRAMSIEEVRAFGCHMYGPPRATVIAVGDAAHDELARIAETVFGEWRDHSASGECAGTVSNVTAPPGSRGTPRLIVVHRPGAAQSELRIGHPATPRVTPDYHALLVLNMILGGQFVSRINLNLREDKGYTYGARTLFDFRRGPGPFLLQVSVQTDATAAAITEAVAEITAIRGPRPATAAELAVARAALTRGFPHNFETVEQIGRAAVQLALHGLPETELSEFVPRVAGVEADAVTQVASRHLQPDALQTVIVGDRDRVVPLLLAAGLEAPEEATR